MNATAAHNFHPRANGAALAVVLRGLEDGAMVGREAVSAADLSDVFSEAWRDVCLRKGHPHVPLVDVTMQVVPTLKAGSDRRCSGFDLEVSVPGGPRLRRTFTPRSLSHVSTRAAQRLIASGVLSDGQPYTFEIVTEQPPAAGAPPASTAEIPFQTSLKSAPLTWLSVPLRDLLKQAAAVDVLDDEVFMVFYTAHALALAEKFSRKGADAVPPVETGGMLIGALCSCPQTGEFFVVVTDVLEVLDAEQTEFSLAYTSKSWTRLQTILRARRAAHPGRCERLVGQCHGHNFVPNDGKICEACRQRPACSLTNLYTSVEDQTWSRAVFARQPWQLCHIFGLAARGDLVNALFSLADGRLQSRGFFKLPDFNPDQWPPQTHNPKT